MKTTVALAVTTLLGAPAKPIAKPPSTKPASSAKPAVVHHVGPLPFLPSIGRIKVEVRDDLVVATEDLLLPKGDYKRGALSIYVALGGPGYPQAADAHLLAVENGALDAPVDAAGDKLATESAPRAPTHSHTLLGPSNMAGLAISLPEASLTRAFQPGNMAILRLRWVYPLPVTDDAGYATLLLRVGSADREPLTLGTLHVENAETARASLCGPNSETTPLSVWGPRTRYASDSPTVAPVLAVRHRDDALCISFKSKSRK